MKNHKILFFSILALLIVTLFLMAFTVHAYIILNDMLSKKRYSYQSKLIL